MYFNNIHIAIYLVIGFLGCLMGLTVGNLNERFANHKEIFSKQAKNKIIKQSNDIKICQKVEKCIFLEK